MGRPRFGRRLVGDAGHPDQTVAPGATASFSGTITNGTGAALSIDAAIDFLASPESNDFEIVFSSGLAALGLLVPTTGCTGPLFEITWGAGVSGGTTAGGHLQLATSGPATPLELSIPFTLRTPGVGAFCTQRVGLTAATSSIASHDSTVISPQIAWHDPGVGIIGFSSTNGATWTHATIATGITGTAAPSLVLDAGRMPHIAYYHAGLGNSSTPGQRTVSGRPRPSMRPGTSAACRRWRRMRSATCT